MMTFKSCRLFSKENNTLKLLLMVLPLQPKLKLNLLQKRSRKQKILKNLKLLRRKKKLKPMLKEMIKNAKNVGEEEEGEDPTKEIMVAQEIGQATGSST